MKDIIAANMRLLRQHKGMTQGQFAAFLGTTRGKIESTERAKATPKVDLANKIANKFGITVQELFGNPLDPKRFPPATIPHGNTKTYEGDVTQEANKNIDSRISQNANTTNTTELVNCRQSLAFAEETIHALKLLIAEKDERIQLLKKQ
jgi:transcriptional regulator with XRE-family HTH domain